MNKQNSDPETGNNVKRVFFICAEKLGEGDQQLGRILIRSAIKTIAKLTPLPYRLIFMNAGVHLCCEGSELIDDLKLLQDLGIELLCCGTCLDFYKQKDKLVVGRVSNMLEILSTLNAASSVIRI